MAQTASHTREQDHSGSRDEDIRRPQGRLDDSPMMAHLLKALRAKTDIGHYGRLVFVMVARHFMSDAEMVRLLASQPGLDDGEARSLVMQVKARDYNPPRREKIMAWQAQQKFPIIPNPHDPDSGNIYRELRFPEGVYEDIEEYYEDEAEAA